MILVILAAGLGSRYGGLKQIEVLTLRRDKISYTLTEMKGKKTNI